MPLNYTMLKLNIREFIQENTFFLKQKKISINKMIKDYSNSNFGEDITMYYFNRRGYNITFVYNELENIIIAEQIEITILDEIEDVFLKKIISIENYKKELNNMIDSIYCDDSEKVVFMKNGINAHFNNGLLSKITSKSDITRDFVMKFMDKIT